MKEDKLIITVEGDPQNGANGANYRIRVSGKYYKAVKRIADKCGMSYREVADCLISFAIDRLVIKPVAVYKPTFKDKGIDVLVDAYNEEADYED